MIIDTVGAYGVKFEDSGCKRDGRFFEAEGTITNEFGLPISYSIRVAFSDSSSTRLADGLATGTDLQPGETAIWTAGGHAEDPVRPGPLTCSITSVEG